MFAAAFFERLIELAQQLALCVVELDRRLHRDVAIQVAGVAGAHAFDAFATQTELLAGLRAFGQVNRRFTRQGGYIDFAAERRRHDADRHVAVQVVAIALKNVVLLEADFNVQITRGAAVGARLTIARAANAHAVVDTGRKA